MIEQKRKFSEEQQKAIQTTNKNLLVSAGAGSGKTTVLIERIVNLVIEKRIPISKFLVVTFTKAAASEMKFRLAKKIEEIEPKDTFLIEQINECSNADIETIDAFCSKVVKQNFFEVGIDPGFSVLDEIESNQLKNKAIDQLITGQTKQKNKDFFEITDILSQNRNDANFRKLFLKMYDFSCSVENFDDWFNRMIEQTYSEDESQNPNAKLLCEHFYTRAYSLRRRINDVLQECLSADKKQQRLINILNEMEINLIKVRSGNSIFKNNQLIDSIEKVSSLPTNDDSEIYKKVSLLKEQYKKFFEAFKETFASVNDRGFKQEIHENIRRLTIIKKLIDEFNSIYSKEKEALSVLDFSDLEKLTLRILNNEEVLNDLKEKFVFCMIDEYQDTSPIQESILTKISRDDNLFVVGDVKQSIYGFRLSEPQIFLDRLNLYTNNPDGTGENIFLNENYRSHQEVLEFVNYVFANKMEIDFGGIDYQNTSMLKKGGDAFPDAKNKLKNIKINIIKKNKKTKEKTKLEETEVYSVLNHKNSKSENLLSSRAEGIVVVETLKKLFETKIYDTSISDFRFVEPKDIAILSATRGEFLENLTEEIRKRGFNLSTDLQSDIFDDDAMKILKDFFAIIDNTKQDIPLFSVLVSPIFQFSLQEMAEIKLTAMDEYNFFNAVDKIKKNDLVSVVLKQKLIKAFECIDSFVFYSKVLSVDELIDRLLCDTAFLDYISCEKNGEEIFNRIQKLKELIIGKNYASNISQFLKSLEDVFLSFDNSGVPAVTGSALVQGETVLHTMQNIKVTTIHKSKGLEFPIVILVGAGRNFNFTDLSDDLILDRNFGIGISSFDLMTRTKSNGVIKESLKIVKKKKLLEEQLRVLYVALTRAINNLIIIGCGDPEDIESQTKENFDSVCFFDFMAKGIDSFIKAKGFRGSDYLQRFSLEFLNSEESIDVEPNVSFGVPDENLENEILNNMSYVYPYESSKQVEKKYSVSDIVSHETEDVFISRLFESSSVQKGVAFHKVMQCIDFSLKTQDEVTCFIQKMVDSGDLTADQLGLIDFEQIYMCISNPLFRLIASGKKKFLREQEFIFKTKNKNLFDDGTEDEVLVQGVVDLVVLEDDGLTIIDYKTNSVKNVNDLKKKYKKQLDIYAAAMSEAFVLPVKNKVIYSFCLDEIAIV